MSLALHLKSLLLNDSSPMLITLLFQRASRVFYFEQEFKIQNSKFKINYPERLLKSPLSPSDLLYLCWPSLPRP